MCYAYKTNRYSVALRISTAILHNCAERVSIDSSPCHRLVHCGTVHNVHITHHSNKIRQYYLLMQASAY